MTKISGHTVNVVLIVVVVAVVIVFFLFARGPVWRSRASIPEPEGTFVVRCRFVSNLRNRM